VSFWWLFSCVHDAVATRGQYLALSKVWWSLWWACVQKMLVVFLLACI